MKDHVALDISRGRVRVQLSTIRPAAHNVEQNIAANDQTIDCRDQNMLRLHWREFTHADQINPRGIGLELFGGKAAGSTPM